MKKKKLLISPAIIKTDAQISAEVERRMALDDAEKFSDPRCEKLPPCVLCHADGDAIRKAFVPVDCALKLKQNGLNGHTSISISLCAKCMVKLLKAVDEEDSELIYMVLNNNDLRNLAG